MRCRRDLTGLPVVEVDSGRVRGKVRDVVFNLDRGRVRGLVVSPTAGETGFLPFEQVYKVGVSAVTVGVEAQILPWDGTEGDRAGVPLGKRVLSCEGEVLGVVDDVLFDPESGAVWGYQVTRGLLSDLVDGKRGVSLTDEVVVGPDSVVVPNGRLEPPQAGEGGGSG